MKTLIKTANRKVLINSVLLPSAVAMASAGGINYLINKDRLAPTPLQRKKWKAHIEDLKNDPEDQE